MIRTRDIVAILCLLILSRMAWDDSASESLSASATLAFYLSRDGMADVISELDIDGDGTSEALAVYSLQERKYQLQILDLKRLHQNNHKTGVNKQLAPFTPSVLFSSLPIENEDAKPLSMTMGHILIEIDEPKPKQAHPKAKNSDINDRTRHYFCGNDWHDASQKCGTPCPDGQSGECPEGERCFADTSCDILSHTEALREDSFELTPGGGLPSLITLWSNGVMTLHSLVLPGEGSEERKEEFETKKRRTAREKYPLELRLMWKISLFENASPDMLWEESNILFLDSITSRDISKAQNGIIVVSGSYYENGDEKRGSNSFVLALDAMDGSKLWDSFINKEVLFGSENMPLPLVRGVTSYARRRSRVPSLQRDEDDLFGGVVDMMPDCTVALKHHLREISPFSYWTSQDATLMATHLDWKRRTHTTKNKHGQQKSITKTKSRGLHRQKKQWHHKMQQHPIYGRPNVLAIQSKGGLQVRSLKNGHPLCHMSLLQDTVYTDLNNDGILDQVQVLLATKTPSNPQFAGELVSRLREENLPQQKNQRRNNNYRNANLCHAMALSGVPANEELFSTSLCSTGSELTGNLDYVPPIIVESLGGRKNTRDIVIALNSGQVLRLQGGSGRKEWQSLNKFNSLNYPTWEVGHNKNALLTRLSSPKLVPALRPLLLAGENSLAVLSIKNGAVLAVAEYPQTSMMRPILTQVSGSLEKSNVIVFSKDGIWCYQISLHKNTRVFLRVMVGLLFMGLLLAVLANRLGKKRGKDKRSTDI
jgi:hypothetical protein